MNVSDFGGIGTSSPCSFGALYSARSSGPIRPDDRIADANEPAQHAGALGDRIAGVLVDPPGDQFRNPAIGVRVAGRPNVRAHAAHRAIAADHVPELLLGEMSQLIERDQRNLASLPVEHGLVVLEVLERNRRARRKRPIKVALVRLGAEQRIEL